MVCEKISWQGLHSHSPTIKKFFFLFLFIQKSCLNAHCAKSRGSDTTWLQHVSLAIWTFFRSFLFMYYSHRFFLFDSQQKNHSRFQHFSTTEVQTRVFFFFFIPVCTTFRFSVAFIFTSVRSTNEGGNIWGQVSIRKYFCNTSSCLWKELKTLTMEILLNCFPKNRNKADTKWILFLDSQ